jgi:hypothetical protein
VLRLGRIEWKRSGFHTEDLLFPVGYEAERMHWSYMQEKTRVKYTLKVLDPREMTGKEGAAAEVAMDVTGGVEEKTDGVTAPSEIAITAASALDSSLTNNAAAPFAATVVTTATEGGWDLSRPVFEITAADDPDHPIRDQSCSAAWVQLIRRGLHTQSYDYRPKNSAGDSIANHRDCP